MSLDSQVRFVKDEMSRAVVSVAAKDTLLTALELMEEKDLIALPVVDDEDRCVGMITATDVARLVRPTAIRLNQLGAATGAERQALVSELTKSGIAKNQVSEAIRFKLKSVRQETTITEAGREMLWSRFHHLPVVDEENRLIGILSTLDLLAAFVKQTNQQDQHQASAGEPKTPGDSLDETLSE